MNTNIIGFRAHDFGSFNSATELGKAISSIVKRDAKIQLALGKVIPSAKKWSEWDEEYISSIRDDLAVYGVSTAVIGCYINPVHPDKDERKKHIERFKRSLQLNKAFGCPIVGTETGSWTKDISYNVETYEEHVFSTLLSSIDEMLTQAIKSDAICAIEPVAYHHTVCSVERMVRVLEKFPDKHLKVIYDPVNLIPQCGITESDGSARRRPSEEAQRKFYTKALDAFGDRICAIHAKDMVLSDQGYKIGDRPILTGIFDWNNFFKELEKREINVPVLLENHNPATLNETLSALSKF